MEESNFAALRNIILSKGKEEYQPRISELPIFDATVQQAVYHLVRREGNSHVDLIRKFMSLLNEKRTCRIPIDLALQELDEVSFILSKESKLFQFEPDTRAYAIEGKAVSVYKRSKKGNEPEEDQRMREDFQQLIERTIFKLFHEEKLIISKNESHELDDILMSFPISDENIEPIYYGNEVYTPFFPLKETVVMLLPQKLPKPQIVSVMKSTLLHVYMDSAQAVQKIATRETFYKNSTFKGIYFIEEGEVEVASGRVVARGWVTNGKCKNSGYGWKFKPVPFMRCIIRNPHLWKQFLNDLGNNAELPFKVTNLLNLDSDVEAYFNSPGMSNNKKRGSFKLPKVGNTTLTMQKYQEIEKVRHYDDRISQICHYKKNILLKRLGTTDVKDNKLINSSQTTDRQTKMIRILSSKHSDGPKFSLEKQQSSENILIMSVLRKLEVMTEAQADSHKDHSSVPNKKMKIGSLKMAEKNKHRIASRYHKT